MIFRKEEGMPDKRDIIAIFNAETEDRLTKLEKGLVELEKKPQNMELLKELNREAHTLKGAARVFGFSEIQDIAHRIEDIFENVGQKGVIFSSPIAERIFRGLDTIRTVLEKIGREEKVDVDVSNVCKELEQCYAAKPLTRERRREDGGQKRSKGTRGKESGRSGKRKPKKSETIEKTATIEKPDDVTRPRTEAMTPPPSVQTDEYIRVPLSRVNKLLYLVGELVINKMKSSAKIGHAKRISKLSREALKSISGLSDTMEREFPLQNGEVAKLLSQCTAQIQKLTEHNLNLYDTVTTEAFHLDPIIDELQAKMKEIKMLPLSTIVEGFPRMVRDIASQQGKEVNLEIFGEETELDKKVLEGIKASLIHILRNCIDHGIEEGDTRVPVGKPRYGTIKVSAYNEADNVVIVIEDDGRGMDIDKVKETALGKGLVSRDELEKMTEKEILHIVFMNGYSTSPIITDVSGRGIGLDIVMRDMKSLKGQVILDSEKDKGTKFTLVLPLTIAIMQVLLVKAGKMVFALPMLPIEESIEVNVEDVSTIEGRMAIQVREHTVPLVRLSEVLDLPPLGDEEGKTKEKIPAVIANSLDRRVGFLVDGIVGEEEVFVKSLGRHLGKVKNVSGASILGTGEVVIVLDVTDLIANSAWSRPTLPDRRPAPRQRRREKRILVVEDAFSTRELEKSILEAQGYLVDTAVDGLDALDRMTSTTYDLVISDIEMPRMDGFQLCKAFKENEEYKDIPVVMVTALEKEEDKRRGIEVGAAAYIVKSAFEQSNLLDTIERLIG
jgi:two-component system chemotaxis sensor kinase CheA